MTGPRDVRPGEAVANLVDSALRLSASVALLLAEAASGRPQADRPGDTPLQSIIRHGTTAVGSVVATVAAAARAPQAPPAAGQPTPGSMPTVAAGDSLRLPLSVHNPGSEPMLGIVAHLRAVRHGEAERSDALGVSFAPELLTVAPRDFEKLTVTVAVPAATDSGPWSVQFTLTGQEDDPITIAFEVT